MLFFCVFLINVGKFMQTLTKLDLPTLRKGSTEERTQRNKWKIWHSLGLEPRSSAYVVPMLYPLSYGCQWAELNFCPYKLSNLKFTPLPSLHVDFYSRHVIIVFYSFFIIVHCWFHYIIQQFSLKYVGFFLINVVKFMQTLTKLDLPTLRKDATEQMKNLTLARTRTQGLGISSADALPTKLRVPMGSFMYIYIWNTSICIGCSFITYYQFIS